MVQKIQNIMENPRLQIVEQIVEVPEVQMFDDTQTSESLGIAPVRQVAQVENSEIIEIGAPRPAKSAPPMSVTAPVLEVPPVVVFYIQPVPVEEYVESAPAHAVTCAHAAPVVEYAAPAPAVTCAAPAASVTYAASASPVTKAAATCATAPPAVANAAPTVTHGASPVTYAGPAPVATPQEASLQPPQEASFQPSRETVYEHPAPVYEVNGSQPIEYALPSASLTFAAVTHADRQANRGHTSTLGRDRRERVQQRTVEQAMDVSHVEHNDKS